MEQIWKDITLDLFHFGVLLFSSANHPDMSVYSDLNQSRKNSEGTIPNITNRLINTFSLLSFVYFPVTGSRQDY